MFACGSRGRVCDADCIAKRYAVGVQLVVRVPEGLVASVDALVSSGRFASRSETVRAGLESLIERERRAATGRAIVGGYEKLSQDGDDLEWPDSASAAMIAEEPW